MILPTGNNVATRWSGGFTLIELLVAAAIMGLVITAVGAVLGAGIRTWMTARNHLRVEAGAMLGLSVLERDIMNAEPYQHQPFRGSREAMLLPVGIPDPLPEGIAPSASRQTLPGWVRYRYDPAQRAVIRQTGFIDTPAPVNGEGEIWVGDVESVYIRYREDLPPVSPEQPMGDIPGWRDIWQDPLMLPAAIHIALNLSVRAEPGLRLERTIVLPRGRRGSGEMR